MPGGRGDEGERRLWVARGGVAIAARSCWQGKGSALAMCVCVCVCVCLCVCVSDLEICRRLIGPSHSREGEEARREPRVEHILILLKAHIGW